MNHATDHEKVATLAAKLEFANALCKQHQRDKAKAEIELGKMVSYCKELEHKLNLVTGLSKNQLARIRITANIEDTEATNKALRDKLRVIRAERDRLIAETAPTKLYYP